MKNGCLRFTFLKMKKTMNPHFAFSLIMTNNKRKIKKISVAKISVHDGLFHSSFAIQNRISGDTAAAAAANANDDDE